MLDAACTETELRLKRSELTGMDCESDGQKVKVLGSTALSYVEISGDPVANGSVQFCSRKEKQ